MSLSLALSLSLSVVCYVGADEHPLGVVREPHGASAPLAAKYQGGRRLPQHDRLPTVVWCIREPLPKGRRAVGSGM